MRRSLRMLGVAAVVAIAFTTTLYAAPPPAPELDPATATAGVTALIAGSLYLVERFRNRR